MTEKINSEKKPFSTCGKWVIIPLCLLFGSLFAISKTKELLKDKITFVR